MPTTDHPGIPSDVNIDRYWEEGDCQFLSGTCYDTKGRILEVVLKRRPAEILYCLTQVSELHDDESAELLWSFSLEGFNGCALLLDAGPELVIGLVANAIVWHVIPLNLIFSGDAVVYNSGGLAYYVDPETSVTLKVKLKKTYPHLSFKMLIEERSYLEKAPQYEALAQYRSGRTKKTR